MSSVPVPVPRTLVEFAGLPRRPSHPAVAVLLLIDGQREYTTGRLPLEGVDAAVEEGARSTVVAAATATRDLPHFDGAGVVPAEQVQQAALAALSDRFSMVIQDTGALLRRAVQAA